MLIYHYPHDACVIRVLVFIYACLTTVETGMVFGMNNEYIWNSVEFSRRFYPGSYFCLSSSIIDQGEDREYMSSKTSEVK